MLENITDNYESLIEKGLYKQAQEYLKRNPQLSEEYLEYELNQFRNPKGSKEISKKGIETQLNKISNQLKEKSKDILKIVHRMKRRSIAQFHYRHFENRN